MFAVSRIGFVLGAAALAGCATSPDRRAEDEALIHAKIREWSAAAEAKDLDKTLSFYAPDAVLMLEGVPDIEGAAALRAGLGGMMQDPNFALSFAADDVQAARSSDLAYETGTYSLTVSGPDGEPVTEQGHYVVVWVKQPDGSWKVKLDVPVSD